VCVCVRACVRACLRACVCVRACVRARSRAYAVRNSFCGQDSARYKNFNDYYYDYF